MLAEESALLVWGMGRTTTTPGPGQQWSLQIEIEREDGEGNKPRREREKASTRHGRGTRETQLTGPLPCPSGTWEADLYGVKLIPGGRIKRRGLGSGPASSPPAEEALAARYRDCDAGVGSVNWGAQCSRKLVMPLSQEDGPIRCPWYHDVAENVCHVLETARNILWRRPASSQGSRAVLGQKRLGSNGVPRLWAL